ncbi:MAG: sugar kinase [Elusimicrobia bacterium]|nr:sugar kinase [Elusimicrobiota bacterium]
MGIVVVGSIALDVLSTPKVKRKQVLGGSAIYASLSLSNFAPVKLVGIIGEDYPNEALELLRSRGIDLAGIEKMAGRTFAWEGEYGEDLAEAKTIDTQLNVFGTFSPKLPEEYRREEAVFLGNISPDLQADVLSQMENPTLAAADTMNLWINTQANALKALLPKIHVFFVNEAEAKALTGERKVLRAAHRLGERGPRLVVIKSGEHGAMAYDSRRGQSYWAPAFPAFEVVDPTGAGDSFAGGFLGILLQSGDPYEPLAVKKALAAGNVMSSFALSALSIDGLAAIGASEVQQRLQVLSEMMAHAPDAFAARLA